MKIGFVGLGIMGRPMALHLIKGGHDVVVYARRQEMTQPHVEAGARAAATPAEAAKDRDVVFTMVSDTPDVEAVIFGPEGIASTIRSGAYVVDMSSISPTATQSMAKRLRAQGVGMIDAPVSGGDVGAINATLSIMCGAEEADFNAVLPLLQLLGKNIIRVGSHGAGQVAKLANNLVIAATVAGVAEAFIMARKAGVDPARVREALLGGFAQSRVLEVHGMRMLEDNYQPGFKARLHQKDLKNAVETARDLGLALPSTAQVMAYMNAQVGQGGGELDSTSMVRVLEAMNGVKIKQ